MFKKQIQSYVPMNEQEVQDQKVILNYIKLFEHNILTRENAFAHLTSSGFILNETNGFDNGVYIIKIMSGNLMFSGIASVVVGKITVDDEIMLHMSGIPQVYADGTQGRIYAKIAPSTTADYGEIYLATNVPQSAITNLSITMKKMI